MSTLLGIPNVSEGRDAAAIGRIGAAFAAADGARLLDVHADPDHHRSVFTVAAPQGPLADALVIGSTEALRLVDLRATRGIHPHVGAVDVVPVVHLDRERRGAACAEALTVAGRIGDELEVPVLLYGALAGGRTRAQLRRGGPQRLRERIEGGDLRPDFGPARWPERSGAVLVAARPPLVAFNLELAEGTLERARAIAAAVREGGEGGGLPGVRALGLWLGAGGIAQVSCNVEDHERVPLAELLAAVRRHAPVAGAELVGLAPEAALEGWPDDVPIRNRRTVEEALRGGP